VQIDEQERELSLRCGDEMIVPDLLKQGLQHEKLQVYQ
jgi:hypothetical protein